MKSDPDGAGRLAGLRTVAHCCTSISATMTLEQPGQRVLQECWGGVCAALAHLNLEYNGIKAVGKMRFGSSWRVKGPRGRALQFKVTVDSFVTSFQAPNGMIFIGLHRSGSSRPR